MMTKFVRVFLQNCLADFFLLALGVSSQLLFVTENNVKIWSILINYEIILFIMSLLNSRYAYSNLSIEFWFTSLWHCTIHFKVLCFKDVIPNINQNWNCMIDKHQKLGLGSTTCFHLLTVRLSVFCVRMMYLGFW